MADTKADDMLAEIRAAMKHPDVRLHLPLTFTHGVGVQVYIKGRKVGPLLFPPDGGTVADTLHMLGEMAATR
jgi:hypothetical protein